MTPRIGHELPDIAIEVFGGRDEPATIHDYDIVLLMLSQLTQAKRDWRAGRGPRQPCVSSSMPAIAAASAAVDGARAPARRTGYFWLLSDAELLSRADNGRIKEITLGISSWPYTGAVCELHARGADAAPRLSAHRGRRPAPSIASHPSGAWCGRSLSIHRVAGSW
jgi:hypothetical protein